MRRLKGAYMSLSALSHFASSGTPAPEQNLCKEWSGILEDYRMAARHYSNVVMELTSTRDARFDQAWTRAEHARKACESCRSRLLDHEHDHACFALPPKAASSAASK